MESSAPDPEGEYEIRLKARRASANRNERTHRTIGNFKLALLALTAVLAWLSLDRHLFGAGWLSLPGGVLLFLFFAHERVLRAKVRNERAAAFYEGGLARIQYRWSGKGESGDRFLDPSHPYAADLDLFGKGSLFELLCSARTRAGEETLASWLKSPARRDEVLARQEAVAELRRKLDLREELALLGEEMKSGVHAEELVRWSSNRVLIDSRPARWAAAGLALLAVSAALLWAFGASRDWFLAILILEGGFALNFRNRVRKAVVSVERPGEDLALLAGVLARLERERFLTQKLVRLRADLETDGIPASRQIARLHRRIVLLDARRNQFFAPLAGVLLWTTQCAFAIERWRKTAGPGVPRWLAAVGELEALCALAGYAFEHPADPFPQIVEQPACFLAEDLGHPLLPDARSVRNHVKLGGGVQTLIVSGSNMSGKSTLLRSVGTNSVLAMAGAPVRATRLVLSPLAVGASLRIVDSLQEGSSRFYAEILRLRRLVEMARGPLPLLFLLDELLHGTNSHDRKIGAEAVVRGLVDMGAIGLVTTHDLSLCHIEEVLAPRAANVHFEDHLEEGRITFDYRLREGIVEKSNALELMRSIGLEV